MTREVADRHSEHTTTRGQYRLDYKPWPVPAVHALTVPAAVVGHDPWTLLSELYDRLDGEPDASAGLDQLVGEFGVSSALRLFDATSA